METVIGNCLDNLKWFIPGLCTARRSKRRKHESRCSCAETNPSPFFPLTCTLAQIRMLWKTKRKRRRNERGENEPRLIPLHSTSRRLRLRRLALKGQSERLLEQPAEEAAPRRRRSSKIISNPHLSLPPRPPCPPLCSDQLTSLAGSASSLSSGLSAYGLLGRAGRKTAAWHHGGPAERTFPSRPLALLKGFDLGFRTFSSRASFSR